MTVKVGIGARWTRRAVTAAAAVGLTAAASGCAAPRWQSELVSTNAAGTDSADGVSWGPRLSPDGTMVLFHSDGSNLGPTDTNGLRDIYLRDVETGETSLISENATGSDAGDDQSGNPQFDRDGSRVLFLSGATDLSPITTSGHSDLYLRDLATGTTTLVTVAADGSDGGDENTDGGEFSPDGGKILFTSYADNLAGAPSDQPGVFERDLATGVTRRLADGSMATYSPSGDTIAYLHGGELRLQDTRTGAATVVSTGLPGSSRGSSPAFSPDGTRVAFERRTNDTYLRSDIYVHERRAGTNRLVTVGAGGTGGSDNSPSRIRGFHPTDSDQVLFTSTASNLVANDRNPWADVFVRNVRTGVTTIVSANAAGTATAGGESTGAVWVGDGSRIAFTSSAGDLGPTDANGEDDVFVRDMGARTTALVSANAAGTGSGNGGSGRYRHPGTSSYSTEVAPSADGSRIAFGSDASNLGPVDTPRPVRHDIYLARLSTPPS
jgi:Tol biopolymer transport system component